MKQEILEPWVSPISKDNIFRSPKRRKCSHEATYPWTMGFTTR